MDPVTHMLAGAAVAQLPAHSNPSLSWQKCALVGAVSAILPDVDYALFLWHPLEFIAYWHRAETHSLLLAPLWALLFSQALKKLFNWQQHSTLLFKICLAGILSHAIIDTLTTFGTQWFAPFSDYRMSWNLLFVLDGYFTLCIIVTLMTSIIWRNKGYILLSWLIPVCYLAVVFVLKQAAFNQIPGPVHPAKERSLVLFPQPFSPLYWQAIESTRGEFRQAYLRLANDILATQLSKRLGLKDHQQNYQQPAGLIWRRYSISPENIDWQADARQVWSHQKFKAFRDFAKYPVFTGYQESSHQNCLWFSDLRYHWPDMAPSFRYGMCRSGEQPWQLYRIKYFSEQQVEISDK